MGIDDAIGFDDIAGVTVGDGLVLDGYFHLLLSFVDIAGVTVDVGLAMDGYTHAPLDSK